jgi:hypothetical protein
MNPTPRWTLLLQLGAGLLVIALLAVLPWSWPGEPQGKPVERWQIEDLLEHLRGKGLQCRVVTCMEVGPVNEGVFFTTTDLSWRDLNALPTTVWALDKWKGVVQCRRIGYAYGADTTLGVWGEGGERLGPFALFGDPALRAKIRALFSDCTPTARHTLF